MRSRRRRLWTWLVQSLVTAALLTAVTALPEVIKVGGLFETTDEQQERAFRYAIDRINADISYLPKSRLSAQVIKVAPQNSFRAMKHVCEFLEVGVAAVLGPPSPSITGVLQSTCNKFQIPLLHTHWDCRSLPTSHGINLFPDTHSLGRAFLEVIQEKHWKSFTLIYEENEALIRLQEILKAPTLSQIKVTLRHIKPEQNMQKIMKDLYKLRENNFVVDLPLHKIHDLFENAAKVQMMTEYQNYFITSLDIHTVDWDTVFTGRANITALRVVDPERPQVSRVVRDWIFGEERYGRRVDSNQPIKTEAALLYDAVMLIAKALEVLDRSQEIELKSLSCNRSNVWRHGIHIVNYIKMTHLNGLSGDINLDKDGLRTNFSVDIVKLTKRGIIKIGNWDPHNHVRFEKLSTAESSDIKEMLKNRTLRVTTILTPPYVMEREPIEELKGNDRYEGFCVDIIQKIADKYGFKVLINPVKDGKYGSEVDGEWNGMIGELLKREADIAIADLTITFAREQAVDFTMPFMNLGISILFKKPVKKNPPLFSFLQPLSLEVWFYMVTAFLGVSLFLFILARLSPYEWVNPHPCDADNDVVENQFNLLNSFWFVIGSIMQQGSDLLPRAISTRIVASSWWFFTLIMISSYTANLAAFLTAQRMTSPIESAADLAKQTTIHYGSVKGGSTSNFFKKSDYPTYKRMWTFMESTHPTVFTKNNEKGIERVMMGNYAFLMESRTIEYITASNCELTKIGGELDRKGYGIATPSNSPYRNLLSSGILELQEQGQLHILKEKWWKRKANRCTDDSGAASAEMGIGNVGGVFVVLGIGVTLGCIIVVIEFVWRAKKRPDRGSIPVMLWQELKFILTSRGSTRPAPKDDEEPSVDKFPMAPIPKNESEKYS